MSLLLATDDVELIAPSTETDEHGWALTNKTPYWRGVGNLQLGPGQSDALAGPAGERGHSIRPTSSSASCSSRRKSS